MLVIFTAELSEISAPLRLLGEAKSAKEEPPPLLRYKSGEGIAQDLMFAFLASMPIIRLTRSRTVIDGWRRGKRGWEGGG